MRLIIEDDLDDAIKVLQKSQQEGVEAQVVCLVWKGTFESDEIELISNAGLTGKIQAANPDKILATINELRPDEIFIDSLGGKPIFTNAIRMANNLQIPVTIVSGERRRNIEDWVAQDRLRYAALVPKSEYLGHG